MLLGLSECLWTGIARIQSKIKRLYYRIAEGLSLVLFEIIFST